MFVFLYCFVFIALSFPFSESTKHGETGKFYPLPAAHQRKERPSVESEKNKKKKQTKLAEAKKVSSKQPSKSVQSKTVSTATQLPERDSEVETENPGEMRLQSTSSLEDVKRFKIQQGEHLEERLHIDDRTTNVSEISKKKKARDVTKKTKVQKGESVDENRPSSSRTSQSSKSTGSERTKTSSELRTSSDAKSSKTSVEGKKKVGMIKSEEKQTAAVLSKDSKPDVKSKVPMTKVDKRSYYILKDKSLYLEPFLEVCVFANLVSFSDNVLLDYIATCKRKCMNGIEGTSVCLYHRCS